MKLTYNNYDSWLETIWNALENYREDCIPEGNEKNDDEWSDICTAMAWLTEHVYTLEDSLGRHSNSEFYARMLKPVTSEEVRNLSEELAAEEQEHKAKIE